MLVQSVHVSQLVAAPYNPRLDLKPGDAGWKRLEKSLKEFDLVQPIVWNRSTGHVVSGHQRLQILKSHGETEVPCAVVELSLAREKALNVALNNSQVGGDWHADKLIDLLSELRDDDSIDETLTGYDHQNLLDLLFCPAVDFEAESDSPSSDSLTESEHVSIMLTVPKSDWTSLEPAVNRLLQDFPQMRLTTTSSKSD